MRSLLLFLLLLSASSVGPQAKAASSGEYGWSSTRTDDVVDERKRWECHALKQRRHCG